MSGSSSRKFDNYFNKWKNFQRLAGLPTNTNENTFGNYTKNGAFQSLHNNLINIGRIHGENSNQYRNAMRIIGNFETLLYNTVYYIPKNNGRNFNRNTPNGNTRLKTILAYNRV